MVIGILSDKFKSWQLIILMSTISIIFYIVIAANAFIGYGLYVGIIGSALFVTTIQMLCQIMLGKVAKKECRATLYGAFSFSSGIGLLTINLLGGWLYSNVSIIWPYLLGIITLGGLIVLTLIFGLTGQLKV